MTYIVAPFSRGRWADGTAHEKCPPDTDPCAICGRPVRKPWPHSATVIDGGNAWGDDDSPQDAGYMGWWPVGNDCHRQFSDRHTTCKPMYCRTGCTIGRPCPRGLSQQRNQVSSIRRAT